MLPFSLIQNNETVSGLVYFLSIVNGLQGVCLFVHFFITYQVILDYSRHTVLRDYIGKIFGTNPDTSSENKDDWITIF